MMSHLPQQLMNTLKMQQKAVEATMQALEVAIHDSMSATSQLKLSMACYVEAPSGNSAAEDPTVSNVQTAPVAAKKLMSPSDILDSGVLPIEDGTLLGKIYGEQARKTKIKWPSVRDGWWVFFQGCTRMIVDHPWFECIISLAILVNSVMLGVESQMSLDHRDIAWSKTAEICFLIIFTFEILLRLIAHRSRIDGWFLFDALLVFIAFVDQFIQLLSAGTGAEQQVLILRTMRLFRLIRTFRMIKQIRSIWRLVYGLVTCGETIISTFTLLFIVNYVFGVMGLELITKDQELRADPEINEIVTERFNSLPVAMMTLAQFVTMDSIGVIHAPLVKKKALVLGLYFGLLIIVVSISLMNLVTAVMVEGALEHARQEKEEEEKLAQATAKQLVPEIISLFDQIDADGSGEVDLKEMAKFQEEGVVPEYLLDRASVDSVTDLFALLDVDGSGIITRQEFIEGLLSIFLREIPVSVLQLLKMTRKMRDDVSQMKRDMNDVSEAMNILRPEPSL